jgi:hypothetical protein
MKEKVLELELREGHTRKFMWKMMEQFSAEITQRKHLLVSIAKTASSFPFFIL